MPFDNTPFDKLRAGGEAVTDPNVPLLPPHITLEQARNMTAALVKGDSNTPGIIRQTVKAMLDTVSH
jgi:pyruvate dehydrogenase (quinone)